LRGFTCSAFGKGKVTTPCSIWALILLVSLEGIGLESAPEIFRTRLAVEIDEQMMRYFVTGF
jgi:hypothetical protein